MKCPQCQHENRSGAKFCEECATPMARTCSNCGNRLSATAKFCPECAHPIAGSTPGDRFASPASYTPKHLAEKILTSRSALEGERKQVTVLFVDISGFTSLSERLDVEEVHRLITSKAEGNPFYLEELVKSLEEGGALRRQGSRYELTRAVGELAIPGTIQDVIAARIDRLAEAPKRTLQLAAVIGREFTRRLVDRLAEVRERT